MEVRKISRLREEQQKALSDTEEQLKQIEKYKSDYKALQKRLKTLPDKVTHDVMVPFGKLAFMPGKLVHTNEMLVLLGDNWFVERSATQAWDIAGRRIKELDKRIAELKEQKSLLEPRLGMTSELQNVAEGIGDYQEIVEEYDEEKERLWDEQHKKNVREMLREQRKVSKLNEKGDAGRGADFKAPSEKKSDEDLWSRLEFLEKQEAERGELNSSFESDGSDSQGGGDDTQRKKEVSPTQDKKVKWIDKNYGDKDSDDGDGEYDDDGDDDNNDNEVKPVIKTISFQHTKTLSPVIHEISEKSTDTQDSAPPNITSPADIIKLLSVKPILKKTKETCKKPPDSGQGQSHSSTSDSDQKNKSTWTSSSMKSTAMSRDKAFTGIVKEHATTTVVQASSANNDTTKSQEQPKRVSKFRAQRMGHNS